MEAHLAAFRAMLGPQGVLSERPDMATYESGARYGAGRAALVLRPSSTEEVSACVGYCVRNGVPFVPQSGNTGLTGASTPDDSGSQVVLSLDRLNAPCEVRQDDRLAVVGAGVRLSALNAALEPFGLFLPIDLGADPMIGGMVATNTGGARFLRYGDMRRHVLGLKVVLADEAGTVLDLMTDLRKDNARLDLKHLFIGSSGAFGVVTEAVVEVHRRPTSSCTALLIPRDDDATLEILCGLEAAVGDNLSAFEGMSGSAMSHALTHVPALRDPFGAAGVPAYAVLVELSCGSQQAWNAPLSDLLIGALAEIAEGASAPLQDAFVDPGRDFWSIRHALSEGLRAAGPVVGLDLSFARSRVMPFRHALRAELADLFPELEVCDFGHIADGGLHFNLVARTRISAERLEGARRHVIERAVRDFEGSFSAEHGLGPTLQSHYDALTPVPLQRYARQVEAAFHVQRAAKVRFG